MAEDGAHFKDAPLKLPGHQLVPLPIIAQMMDIDVNECTECSKQLFGPCLKETSGSLGKISHFFHLFPKFDNSHHVLSTCSFFNL